MYHSYVLVSEIKGLRFYVGISEDVEARLKYHNDGRVTSTKAYRPWKLFFSESFATRTEARDREKYLKSGSGKERIKERLFRSS